MLTLLVKKCLVAIPIHFLRIEVDEYIISLDPPPPTSQPQTRFYGAQPREPQPMGPKPM